MYEFAIYYSYLSVYLLQKHDHKTFFLLIPFSRNNMFCVYVHFSLAIRIETVETSSCIIINLRVKYSKLVNLILVRSVKLY